MSLLCSRLHSMQNIRSILDKNLLQCFNRDFYNQNLAKCTYKLTSILDVGRWGPEFGYDVMMFFSFAIRTNKFFNLENYIWSWMVYTGKGFRLAWHMILGWSRWGKTCQENIWNNILHPQSTSIQSSQYLKVSYSHNCQYYPNLVVLGMEFLAFVRFLGLS